MDVRAQGSKLSLERFDRHRPTSSRMTTGAGHRRARPPRLIRPRRRGPVGPCDRAGSPRDRGRAERRSRAVKIRHFTSGRLISRALRNLVVGQADHVPEQERRLQVDVQALDRAPERLDRLERLDRRVRGVQRVDRIELDRLGPALPCAVLVEHAVLGDLEQPGRELRAEREARKALVHAEEDLLRQVLGQAAIADQAIHVAEHRLLVRADELGKRCGVPALRVCARPRDLVGEALLQCSRAGRPLALVRLGHFFGLTKRPRTRVLHLGADRRARRSVGGGRGPAGGDLRAEQQCRGVEVDRVEEDERRCERSVDDAEAALPARTSTPTRARSAAGAGR